MKKSFVFDVLFFLLMFGVIACEEEIESLTFSKSVNQEGEGISYAFNDFFSTEKSSDNLTIQEKTGGQSFYFSSDEIRKINLPTPPKSELQEGQVKVFVNEVNRKELENQVYSLAFVKRNVKMVHLKGELPDRVEDRITPKKELKLKSFS